MVIGEIPAGATLSDADHNTLTVTSGSIVFTANEIAEGYLTGLAITPPNDANFSLSMMATATDGNGYNYTVPATEAVTVDPNAPAITAVVGQPVNGGTVELTGTGERGDTINLYADGGTTIVGTATVASGGTFDITTTADFADGVHTFTATETDAASRPARRRRRRSRLTSTECAGDHGGGRAAGERRHGRVDRDRRARRHHHLYADGGTTIVGTATVASGGTFDITTTADFADGVHTFTATEPMRRARPARRRRRRSRLTSIRMRRRSWRWSGRR